MKNGPFAGWKWPVIKCFHAILDMGHSTGNSPGYRNNRFLYLAFSTSSQVSLNSDITNAAIVCILSICRYWGDIWFSGKVYDTVERAISHTRHTWLTLCIIPVAGEAVPPISSTYFALKGAGPRYDVPFPEEAPSRVRQLWAHLVEKAMVSG